MGCLFSGIFGSIALVFKSIFNLIVKILSAIILKLHLGLPFLYMLLGIIAHLLTGFLKRDGEFFMLFHIGLAVVLGFSVIQLFRGFFKAPREKAYTGNVQITPPTDVLQQVRPQIFRVRNNPEFILHEYPDRFELFRETPNGIMYIRTDYKNI